MTPADLALSNLANWSVQAAALIGAGIVAAELFAWRHPQSRLRFFQALLGFSLLLPLLSPWRHPEAPTDFGGGSVTVRTYEAIAAPGSPSFIDWPALALTLLAGGILLQLIRLAVSVFKLRSLRRSGKPVAVEGLVGVEVRAVPGIKGPAAFGWSRPVILLPASMAAGPVRDAAFRHELQHVLRGDWIENLAERIAAAFFWFHPMVWWLTERIHVTREQAVDAEVAFDGVERDQYLHSLLISAGLANHPAIPAHSFIRRPRHLVERVEFLTEVTTMSFRQTAASAALATLLSGGAAMLAGYYLPLQLAAQESGAAAITWTRPHSSEGIVQLEAVLNSDGEVIDARVLSGPEELRRAALQQVLGWRSSKDASSRRSVSITIQFKKSADFPPLPPPPPPQPPPVNQLTFEGVDYMGLSPEIQQRASLVMAGLQSGQKLTDEQVNRLRADLRAIDPLLRLGLNMTPTTLRLSVSNGSVPPQPPKQIRVGGNATFANLISKVAPVYPPAARQARIQGTVRFDIVIGRDGSVENIQLLSGHPLFVQPAREAVSQWKYRPVMLNGNPTSVVTVVDVNFTLSEP